jgi:hypothetical protein
MDHIPDLMQAGDFSAFAFRAGVKSGIGASVLIYNTSVQGDVFAATKSPTLNSVMGDLEAAKVSLVALESYKIRFVYPGYGEPFVMEQLVKDVRKDGTSIARGVCWE